MIGSRENIKNNAKFFLCSTIETLAKIILQCSGRSDVFSSISQNAYVRSQLRNSLFTHVVYEETVHSTRIT